MGDGFRIGFDALLQLVAFPHNTGIGLVFHWSLPRLGSPARIGWQRRLAPAKCLSARFAEPTLRLVLD